MLIGRWLANFMQMLTHVLANKRATSLIRHLFRFSLPTERFGLKSIRTRVDTEASLLATGFLGGKLESRSDPRGRSCP